MMPNFSQPAPPPVDGAQLLDDLHAALVKYVKFPDVHAEHAVALWVAASHAVCCWNAAPRLVVNSPQKRCGKSRLLDVIGCTCQDPLATSNATVAAIFRSVDNVNPPTLIFDEADAIFGTRKAAEQHEDLRALLNAGYQRGKPVLRCVNLIPAQFPTFAMVALAGIGNCFPDTITDRAINVTLRRRARNEKVSQFRSRRDEPALHVLRDRLIYWIQLITTDLEKAEPRMPVEDRAADTWEPMMAIADAAGGDWPARARAACVALVKAAEEADEDQSLGTNLLADIKQIFADTSWTPTVEPFMASAMLVNELRRIDESPWRDFDLSQRKLAWRLKDFGIKPERNAAQTARGYHLRQFTDAFERYLRP
jgi:hypothetical protein